MAMRHALAVLVLSGCAQLVPIDFNNPPPADWPRLEEKLHYVEVEDLPMFCGPVPPGQSLTTPKGCTIVNFQHEVCYVYLASKDDALLEHERWHCKGYPHVGSQNRYTEAWERWKRANSR